MTAGDIVGVLSSFVGVLPSFEGWLLGRFVPSIDVPDIPTINTVIPVIAF